jgi:hypothetical protein
MLLVCTLLTTVSAQIIKTGNSEKTNLHLKENSATRFVVRNSVSELNIATVITDKGMFSKIEMPGYTAGNEVGKPELPVLRNLIEIPYGANVVVTVKSAEIKTFSLTALGYSSKLIPCQPPVSKSDKEKKPLQLNQNEYAKNQLLSLPLVNVEYLGNMRGVRIGRLNISPVQYNPVSNTIKVYTNIEAEIKFENADLATTSSEKSKKFSPYFSSFESKLLNSTNKSVFKDSISKYPVKYVIVSDPMFQSALQPFVQWKTKKGFKVIEAYTNNTSVGNTTTSIKSYLQSLYNAGTASDPAPTYVLFVGDVAQIPSFAGNTGTHVTDLYYCEYTNDFFPEVYYGRFSAQNVNQLTPQIDKTLQYEQYLMPDKSFLNNVVMIAGVDATWAPVHANGQVNYATSTYFNTANGFNCSSYLYPASQNSAAQIIQNVSNGVGFVNYTAHGGSDGWVDPAFNVTDVAGLQNEGKYPLMVGNCCVSNKFDVSECFGESLLRASKKGAVGYIGASNNSTWDEDFWWACGVGTVIANPTYAQLGLGALDRIMHTHGEPFSQWYVSQGQMINAGNLAVSQGSPSSYDYYWEIYHLMGDPSLMPYFKIPTVMNATYMPILPLGNTSFTVNTEAYAYVAISMNGVLKGAALADSLGVAVVSLSPISNPGTVNLVITKQNRQPIITTIPVATPTGPYVNLNNYQLTDASGNNNQAADYGEIIKIDVNLKNIGVAVSNNVTATLYCNNQYINITDSTEIYGNINAGNEKSVTSAYTFKVAELIPDQSIANFTLKIKDNLNNMWNYNFNIILNAPVLNIIKMSILDPSPANNNGRLDPGETVSFKFEVNNSGHADALNTTAVLNSPTSFLTINNPTINLNSFAKGSTNQLTYTTTAANSSATGDSYLLNFNLNSQPYSAQQSYNTFIGMMAENFETANFSKYNWDTIDSNPWTISNTGSFEGGNCAKSGTISDMDTTAFSIYIDVLTNDSISFYRKVSSENNYDYLNFYIDNNKAGRWAGVKSWARVSYAITPGHHLLRWEYVKDQSTASGSDCAWVDFIVFPAIQSFVGVDEPKISIISDFRIYPNPTSDNINLNYTLLDENSAVLRIFSSNGQLVYKEEIDKQSAGNYTTAINTSYLNRGVYYLTLQSKNQILTQKLILTK